MTWTGAVVGAATGAVIGPLLAGLVHSAPEPGPWWWPWRGPEGAAGTAGTTGTSWALRALVGAVAVLLAGLAGAAAGWGAAWPAFVVVALAGAPLAVIDVRTHRLPDRIVLPTAIAAVVLLAGAAAAGEGMLLRALVCGVSGAAVLVAVALASPRSFGLGDAKFGGVLALLLGWISVDAVVVGLFAGFVVGAVMSLLLVAAGRAGWRTAVPFGPALVLGALGTAAVLSPAALGH